MVPVSKGLVRKWQSCGVRRWSLRETRNTTLSNPRNNGLQSHFCVPHEAWILWNAKVRHWFCTLRHQTIVSEHASHLACMVQYETTYRRMFSNALAWTMLCWGARPLRDTHTSMSAAFTRITNVTQTTFAKSANLAIAHTNYCTLLFCHISHTYGMHWFPYAMHTLKE